MGRREFVRLLAGASVAWPFAALAQEVGRTYLVGQLSPFPRHAAFNITFYEELRRSGFIEGKNLTIYYRDYGLHGDLISQYAVELVKAQVDVLLVGGGVAVRAAQQATKTIPILGTADDLVGEGLVDSLARPGGHTTGVSIQPASLDGKRQDILIEAVRGLRRMAALADSNVSTGAKLDTLREAARTHNVELSIQWVAKGEDIATAIDAATASGAEALNVLASPMLHASNQLIMDRVAALRLPSIYHWPETAEAGGFAGYGPRLTSGEFPEIEARQIVKLFRGVKPSDIPVEQPTKFELVINLKTAKAMGVTVPEALLVRADKVIE
jgi:putative ABC transport system substrate-binding protein